MDEEIKKLWAAINGLQEQIGERNRQRGYDRQRITELEDYLKLKENNIRNDYDILVVKLRKEVMKRPRGMTTRDIKEHFGLKHSKQALRLMERTAKDFILDITLQKGRGKNKGWRLKARVSTGLI